jgi:NTP pyrophosphatase (non-canonical NTP hydrolase)
MMDFNKFADKCFNIASDNGFHENDGSAKETWNNPDRVNSILMLVVTELAEAVEANRHNDFENFSEEIADVFIRLFDAAALMNVDLDAAISKKMEKNKTRSYRHGGKRV